MEQTNLSLMHSKSNTIIIKLTEIPAQRVMVVVVVWMGGGGDQGEHVCVCVCVCVCVLAYMCMYACMHSCVCVGLSLCVWISSIFRDTVTVSRSATF